MANGNPAQGNSLDTIAIRITASSAEASRSVDRLTTSLTNLRAVVSSSLSGLSALAGTIGNLSSSLRTLGSSTDNVRGFRNALNRLSQVDLNNVSRNIREMSALNFDIAGLREAVRELSGLSRGMNQVNPFLERGAVHANRFSLGLGGLKGVISTITFSKMIGAMKQMVASTNGYIEAMNLAKVSLGGFFEDANAFSENVSSALGIDQGTLLENMGLFQNLATSFGVSADNAYVLSKNLSQLAYDFASFYDLSIEESFLKFQSALAGELEPIRRSGVDISNARLQQELYDLGIQQNISTLNRADKAILTYIAIMKQSTNEMGDMARTIQSPANMLRILGNQATITGRQIGALFIPALQEILPWAIAVMKVIGQLASTLASLVGFDLNDYLADVDANAFEGMAGDIEDVGTAAGEAAKKMNNLIGGFDELNILKKANASAGTGVIGGNLLDDIDLAKIQYDMLEGLVPTDDLVDQVYAAIDRILKPFQSISFENTIQRFKDFFATIKEQVSEFEWGELGGSLWDSLVGAFNSVLDLSSSVALPIFEAFNVPQVVFTGITAVKDTIALLGNVVSAVTPGIQAFVNTGLKPIAEWAGGIVSDAFSFVSKEMKDLSEWMSEIKPKITAAGEELGKLVANAWAVIKPLADVAWKEFKDIVSEAAGDVRKLTAEVLDLITQLTGGINTVWDFCKELGILDGIVEGVGKQITGTGIILQGFWDLLVGIVKFIKFTFTRDTRDSFDSLGKIVEGTMNIISGEITTTFGKETGNVVKSFYDDYAAYAFDREKWFSLGSNAMQRLHDGLNQSKSKIKQFFESLIPKDLNFGINGSFSWKSMGSKPAWNGLTFASGNVATDPTLAVFGEYPGAKQNPEITAPQSTIYETVVAANTEMVGAVYQMASMIVQAIENNATEVSADSEGIFKAVRKGAAEYKKTHGASAF